jgi:error-prone DNA polymerase
MSLSEHVVQDYGSMSLSLKAHPISFVRDQLRALNIIATKDLREHKNGTLLKVAGLVLVSQRPGTAGGVCFITIEDETGVANLVVFQNLFDTYRKEILQSRLLMVEGQLQIEGQVIHVIVKRCFDFTKLLRSLTPTNSENLPVLTLARPDEKDGLPYHTENKRTQIRDNIQTEVFPKGRNFR